MTGMACVVAKLVLRPCSALMPAVAFTPYSDESCARLAAAVPFMSVSVTWPALSRQAATKTHHTRKRPTATTFVQGKKSSATLWLSASEPILITSMAVLMAARMAMVRHSTMTSTPVEV